MNDETAVEHMGNAAQILCFALEGSRTKSNLGEAVEAAISRLLLAQQELEKGNIGTRKKLRNPMLAIVNPPPRAIATAVYLIEYEYENDGNRWFHEFDHPDDVKAVVLDKSHVLLYGSKAPIIGMFPTGK